MCHLDVILSPASICCFSTTATKSGNVPQGSCGPQGHNDEYFGIVWCFWLYLTSLKPNLDNNLPMKFVKHKRQNSWKVTLPQSTISTNVLTLSRLKLFYTIYKGQCVPQEITVASARNIYQRVPCREIIAVHFANLTDRMITLCPF
jgi:hypothetical protein